MAAWNAAVETPNAATPAGGRNTRKSRMVFNRLRRRRQVAQVAAVVIVSMCLSARAENAPMRAIQFGEPVPAQATAAQASLAQPSPAQATSAQPMPVQAPPAQASTQFRQLRLQEARSKRVRPNRVRRKAVRHAPLPHRPAAPSPGRRNLRWCDPIANRSCRRSRRPIPRSR